MEASKPQIITVAADVHAPIEKVWNYWTSPEHIVNWNFATEDWYAPAAENDLRPEGTFKFAMAAKDGSFAFDFEGVYTDVVHHQKIAYSIADGRSVSISFEQNGDVVRITEIFEAEEMNAIELQQQGWQAILNNFKKYTEQN